MMLHTKHQGFRTCGLETIFSCFPYIRLCKTSDPPPDRPIFGPSGIILTKLVEVHLMMLHTKYQDSTTLVVSDKKIFKGFILKIYF